MTHASLFSGIGGAELAASWMGWDNLFHCEINPFGRKILDYYFKESQSYEDITKTDFREWRGKVDVLTGGFPCQPFSQAGKRKGNEDDRYLWPQMLRAISEIRPTWVVGENVAGIVSMVESCEEIKVGRTDDIFEENNIYRKEQEFTIERICKDFESEGYSVQPIVIPACAVGAPHRRDRVWFVANRNDTRTESKQQRTELSNEFKTVTNTGLQRQKKSEEQSMGIEQFCESGLVADSNSNGYIPSRSGERVKNEDYEIPQQDKWGVSTKRPDGLLGLQQSTADTIYAGNTTQQNEVDTNEPEKMRRGEPQSEFARYVSERSAADTESKQSKRAELYGQSEAGEQEQGKFGGICCKKANINAKYTKNDWANFPTQSPICCGYDGISNRLDGITFSKWRAESIKAYGNAWVPQVAFEIFKAISNSS